nr:hypothetical protein [bacterium]
MSAYDYNQGSGSVLSIWGWIAFILLILVGGYFLYQYIRRLILYYYQLQKTSSWVMLKVSIPKERHAEENEQRMDFREMASVIEPFFAGLEALFDTKIQKKISGQDHISLEIISKGGLVFFYIGTPSLYKESIEKNILAQYPDAIIEEDKERGYSIFKDTKGEIAAGNLRLLKKFFFPVKTYRYLEYDPLNGIVNALSKLG